MKSILSGSAFVLLTSITTMACAGLSPSAADAAASPPETAGHATAQQPVPPPVANPNIKRILQTMGESSTWGHPDLFGQFAGMQRLFEGDYEGALKYFKIGASYADNDPAKGATASLVSMQKLVMPATLRIDFVDGTHRDMRVPVEAWRQTGTPKIKLNTFKRIARRTLDPEHKLPDADRSNNSFAMP